MSWKDRIKAVLDETKSTQKRLASLLGVTPRTIRNWSNGTAVPLDRHIKAMRSMVVQTAFEDMKEESYMAFHSMSTDASARLLENASNSEDLGMVLMATNCIAIKLAAIIQMSSHNPKILTSIKTVFGTPANTKLDVTNVHYVPGHKEVEVTVTRVSDCPGAFVIKTTFTEKGKVSAQFGFTVTDKALITTAKRITAFLA